VKCKGKRSFLDVRIDPSAVVERTVQSVPLRQRRVKSERK
jgi:hypothetical protein